MTTSEAPLGPTLPPEILSAVEAALGDFAEKVRSNEAVLSKGLAGSAPAEPKSFFIDPTALLDTIGMGYRTAPSYLTYETLRQMSERNTVIASILLTRINQVASFCQPQKSKYGVGFAIRPRGADKHRALTRGETDSIRELQQFLLDTGREYNLGRDSFEHFMRKLVRDTLSYDQGCFEKIRTNSGKVHSFCAVPSDTIRIAAPRSRKGTPPDRHTARDEIKYVQLINSQIAAEFTIDEMCFMVRNPRTHLRVFGYGYSELEMLITTVTSHLWAEEWNRRAFSQGSTVKGVFNLKGNIPTTQFEMFKRQWLAQISGVSNAWKTPVVNVEDIQWMPMQMSNTEMGYQMWMEYLIKVACAIYQIDPAEINFDLRGSTTQQPMFMSNNDAQQKISKDRGLNPLLRALESHINRHIIWANDPRFEFAFVGLDAKTEEQAAQLRLQQGQNYLTLNEVRALEDRSPLKNGDIPLNAVYTGYLAQQAQAEQQKSMMAAQGGAPPGGAPPGGAPPGGAPQQAGASQQDDEQPNDPAQPYQYQFDKAPFGDEEREGANNLNTAMAARKSHVREQKSTLVKSTQPASCFDVLDL